MTVPNVDKLYDCGSTLSAAKPSDFAKYEDEYKTILAGVKGDKSTKKLASQFISRFFSKYPSLANEALDAVLDLCEDDEVDIRKQAIKDLPSLCREMKDFLPKIADVLSQLLQTEDKAEVVVIQNSIMSLFRRDAKGTLIGLFSQIRNGGDVVRDRALKFLHLKIKTDGHELISSKDTEAVLLNEVKASIEECTADEFHLFIAMLAATSLNKSVSGQSMIVELIAHSCQIDKGIFDPDDEEAIDRLIQCANAALPYFSSQVSSTQFIDFINAKVLPDLANLDEAVQTQVLKLLAELCMFCGTLTKPLDATQHLYNLLMDAVPNQPENTTEAEAEANFEFTKLECLLFAFHTVASQATEFLAENPDTLKNFKTRLQYFALAIQGYIRKLDEFIKSKTKAELSKEENQVRVVAHRSANNISRIIKDLFHTPPSYKAQIIVSWRPPNDKVAKAAVVVSSSAKSQLQKGGSLKRKSISFEDTNPTASPNKAIKKANTPYQSKKRPFGNGKVYAPPQGKYSAKLDRIVDDEEQAQVGYNRGESRNSYGGNRNRGNRRGGRGNRRFR